VKHDLDVLARAEGGLNVGRARDYITSLPVPTEAKYKQLYADADNFNLDFTDNFIRDAQDELRKGEALLEKFPSLQNPDIKRLGRVQGDDAQELLEGVVSPEETQRILSAGQVDAVGNPIIPDAERTFNFEELRAMRTRLGQRISSLKRASDPTQREKLAAFSSMFEAVNITMEKAASNPKLGAEAKAALELANAAYKKFRTVEELTVVMESSFRVTDLGELALDARGATTAIEKIKKDRVLMGRLRDLKMFIPLQDMLQKLAKSAAKPKIIKERIERLEKNIPTMDILPSGSPVSGLGRGQSGVAPNIPLLPIPKAVRDDLPRMPFDPNVKAPNLRARYLTGLGISSVLAGSAFLPGQEGFWINSVKALGGFAVMTPALFSHALMSVQGQALLDTIMKDRAGIIDEDVAGLLGAFARASVAQVLPSSEQREDQ